MSLNHPIQLWPLISSQLQTTPINVRYAKFLSNWSSPNCIKLTNIVTAHQVNLQACQQVRSDQWISRICKNPHRCRAPQRTYLLLVPATDRRETPKREWMWTVREPLSNATADMLKVYWALHNETHHSDLVRRDKGDRITNVSTDIYLSHKSGTSKVPLIWVASQHRSYIMIIHWVDGLHEVASFFKERAYHVEI